ncbi:Probable LRR receptor-like serine/threonine-protein kinase [Striga hermonthica]|uniref:Probable LRR receptor-like serine/threonine-protein kinase n=1 Tax=Striga hermonthica TaxID=68872 RepID=A0A9N7R9E2_STRHE|nr:Probable LRR receptor-like serine/threonine-protein kinase [Striga hermonthica]
MGFGRFASAFSILWLFFRPSIFAQEPCKDDESLVLAFLQKMGLNPSQENNSFCLGTRISYDAMGKYIVMLDFSDVGLSGDVPDKTIGRLSNLESLDLSSNNIASLPGDLWSLRRLKKLDLSFNNISGFIPNGVGKLVHLQSLDLSFNHFHGSIPEAIGSLVKLQALNLSNNQLDSDIPLQILKCRYLVYLDLSSNTLTGPLHNGFGAAFRELQFLNLAGNRITGRASDLVGLKSIRVLNISGNVFRGSVVGVFEGLTEVIDVSKNRFQGLMGQLRSNSTFNWSNLVYLDISGNQFSGVFSTRISLFAVNLKHLNLAHNRFAKQPFLRVDMFSNLEYLNLSGTNMIGPIPSNISFLRSLRLLDLSHNNLTGRIPLIPTANLKVLDLSYNNLTGNIPYTLLQHLHNLTTFNFSYNQLNVCIGLYNSSFVGLTKSCPIAVDSSVFRKKSPNHKALKLALVLTVSLSCLVSGLLLVAFGLCYQSKRNPANEEQPAVSGPLAPQTSPASWAANIRQAPSVPVVIFHKPLLNLTFADLQQATSGFDRHTLLAEGRLGPVYGGLLPGGLHVAIKVMARGPTASDQEATQELERLGRIRHPNLVPLVGYCLAGERRIVIYEYMENGNLESLLYDLPLGARTSEDWSNEAWGHEGPLVTWGFRYRVALGTARALAYLHYGCSPPIVHRDLKASSVYFDSQLEPRLSDFGLAGIFRSGPEDERGRGYAGPEFFGTGSSSPVEATKKSDVYGFGVILLELITGKRPVGDEWRGGDLVSWVRGLVRSNEGWRAIDVRISGTGPDEKMVETLKIGYLCTAEVPSKRPCMQQVVGLLKDLEPVEQ